MKKLIYLLLLTPIIYLTSCSSGCDDGTCYGAFYERKGISNQYATYIWFGEINGEKSIYRCEKIMNLKMYKSKAIYTKRIKDKNGLTIAMEIKFPNGQMDKGHRISWNGRWECDGCNGVISPNGEYFAYDTEMMDLTSEGFNWEAFWNR
jgi:hypothetical protein